MKKKLLKGYSALLAAGGMYYLMLAALQYDLPYLHWESWAHPNKDVNAYGILLVVYALNIGTPILMLLAAYTLSKKEQISIYLALMLAFFLVLSPLVGKLILLLGVFLVITLRSSYVKST